MERFPIDYGEALLERVRALHAGDEALPGYAGWIRDHMGGRVETFRRLLMPQLRFFFDPAGKDLLDFGCGTGSTTVVLGEIAPGARITGLDIVPEALEIARMRASFHGLAERAVFQAIQPVRRVGDLPLPSGAFDLVLANGVLEHVVPFSSRPQVILEMWRLLRPGGVLFLSETPNLLWPVDRHTTGLPFLPWLPSAWAHRLAVWAGRHREGADLDVRGRRGMTYWGVVRPLRRAGAPYEVLNVTLGGNRLMPAGPPPGQPRGIKRRLAQAVLERGAGPWLARLGIPTVALGPFLEFLALRKLGAPQSAA